MTVKSVNLACFHFISFYEKSWPTNVINEKQLACNTPHLMMAGQHKSQSNQVQSSLYAHATAERSPGAKRGTSARLLRSALARSKESNESAPPVERSRKSYGMAHGVGSVGLSMAVQF